MLRRLLGLAIAAFLSLPSAALAADPAPPSTVAGHYYYLAAVEQGGQTVKLEGKLWIEGDQLGASVGCNSIGAKVTFDLRTLTIVGDLTTTLIGCPKERAAAEAALLAALDAGPFAWDGSGFAGKGARIVASEVGTAPVAPPDQLPPDRIVDPNGTVGGPITEPDPFDFEQCRGFISQKEWDAVFGGGLTGSGTRDGGGSVPGSGSGTTGSSGSGITVDPGTGGASVPGGSGTGKGVPPTGGSVEPAPSASATSKPNARPTATPIPGTVQIAPAPGVIGGPVPGATGGAEPAPAIDLPLIGPGGKPPMATISGPAPAPSGEYCRELLGRIRVMAAAAPNADQSRTGAAGTGAELARDAVGERSIPPILAAALVIVGGLILLAWLRSIPGRPSGQ